MYYKILLSFLSKSYYYFLSHFLKKSSPTDDSILRLTHKYKKKQDERSVYYKSLLKIFLFCSSDQLKICPP
jgi:hypothetical protein